MHNIGEERDVALIDYELSMRGKKKLGIVSRKVVLKRPADLIQDKGTEFAKFKKGAIEIERNEKMKKLTKDGKLFYL